MIWYWSLVPLLLGVAWLVFRRPWGNRVSPRAILLIAIVALVGWVFGQALFRADRVAASRSGGMDLTADLLSLDGRRVGVEDYRGKILFLNFWATWCGPCRMEMPSMARLYERLRGEGLSMIALTDESPQTVRAYLEAQPYPFPILLDPDRTLFRRFGVYALPTTLVLDEQGRVVLEHTGGFYWDSPELIEKFHKLLNE